jgi:hypothetical protein
MSVQATSFLLDSPSEGNTKSTSTHLVSFEEAFSRALDNRLRVSDGSVYELDPKPVTQTEPEPKPYAEVSDLVEVTAAEMSQHVLFVPNTRFHLRVEFENGRDVYISFDGRVKDDTDGVRSYAEPQLSNFYVDGLPSTPDVAGFLFEEDLDVLEEWLIEQGAAQ